MLQDTPEHPFSFKCEGHIPCRICHIYDGDTVHAVIDYKGETVRIICRLYGIDAPEIIGEDYEKAVIVRNRLVQLLTDVHIDIYDMTGSRTNQFKQLIEQNKRIINVSLLGRDKYGRELAIFLDENLKSINEQLVIETFVKVL